MEPVKITDAHHTPLTEVEPFEVKDTAVVHNIYENSLKYCTSWRPAGCMTDRNRLRLSKMDGAS